MPNETPEHAAARIGTVLRGRYRLDRVLGVGGMAVVYKATHRNQAELAVKMLHPELSIRDDIRTRFVREGYVANSVKHPGAVLVVDDDIADDGAPFLVMELLDGLPLDQLWEQHARRLPVAAVLSVGYQLLDVLAAAHAKQIVHRDIKPPNLFVERDGTLKVLDFGIARLRDLAGGEQQATSTGMVLGTPAFMAPEQAMGKTSEIDSAIDQWAAAATLYCLLGGGYVHEGDNAQQVLIRAATKAATPLREVVPSVPGAIASVIDRGLAFEKANRWPSAAAMRDELVRAAASLQLLATRRDELARTLPSPALHPQREHGFDATAGSPHLLPTALEAMVTQQAPPEEMAAEAIPTPLVGGTTSQPLAREEAQSVQKSARERTLRIVAAIVAAGLVVAAGFALNTFRTRTSVSVETAASDASPAAAPPSPTPSTTPVPPAGVALRVVDVAVSPTDAVIEVDDVTVRAVDGIVRISGPTGSVHHVRISRGRSETKVDVVIAETGALPSRVNLAIAPAGITPRTTATTRAIPTVSLPSPAPSAQAPLIPPGKASPTQPTVDRKFD